jgi:hypothetical protein
MHLFSSKIMSTFELYSSDICYVWLKELK